MTSELLLSQHPQTQLAWVNSIFSILFLFYFTLLSDSKEKKDHELFLGPKDQAIDGIKHVFTMCACGAGFTTD